MNHQEPEFGLTILHQMVITNNNKYINKLLEYGIDYNIQDFYGNYSYHYAIIENNKEFLKLLLNDTFNINYNNTNINGETLLHIYLINYDEISDILIKLIRNTNLNIQTNEGKTCLHFIIEKDLWKNNSIKKILESGDKELNLFINDVENINGFDRLNNKSEKEIFLNIVVDSYFNRLEKISKDLKVDWEKYCSNKDINNLMKVLKGKKGNIETICKDKIKKQ